MQRGRDVTDKRRASCSSADPSTPPHRPSLLNHWTHPRLLLPVPRDIIETPEVYAQGSAGGLKKDSFIFRTSGPCIHCRTGQGNMLHDSSPICFVIRAMKMPMNVACSSRGMRCGIESDLHERESIASWQAI